jgi:hypothetical protein
MDSWIESVDEGKYVGALLLDLSKAFDCVPHQKLIQELADLGLSSDTLQWFVSYLTNREQRVCSRQDVSTWKMVSRGVPQGSCLSPLLFNIFVRLLPSCSQTNSTQFADDLTESAADVNPQVVTQKLTEAFCNIKTFCTEHELVINAKKTQLIMFKTARKKIPNELELILDGCSIKPVDSVKLLGITIDQHFTMAEHIDNVVRKCHGSLGAIRRAVPFLSRELLMLAYNALVRSHLEYASAVLAPAAKSHLHKLDVIQKIASRIIAGAERNAHSEPLQNALGMQSLETRRNDHIDHLVQSMIDGKSHPAFTDYFSSDGTGGVISGHRARIGVGKKRFRIHGAVVYNNRRTEQYAEAVDLDCS